MGEEMLVLGIGIISLSTVSFSILFAKMMNKRK